jgi:sugar phosphate isomerase/epimerase
VLGISTCWWHQKEGSGDEIIRDILALGLQGIELEYRISQALYQQMKPHLNREVKVLSMHNFFPKPEDREGGGDLFLLSATEEEERKRAVRYTIRTMDHAEELGAGVVILHLGRVEMPESCPSVQDSNNGDHINISHLRTIHGEQRRARERAHKKHLDAVLLSLEKLNREAEKRGLFLGIENRYYFHEIPDLRETGIILRSFQGGQVRYWHDIGHAHVQEKMGLAAQKEFLQAYGDMLIGVHIHDAKGLDDHLAPGQGEVNYEELWPLLKSSPIRVLEVHSKVDRRDLMGGIQLIRGLEIN